MAVPYHSMHDNSDALNDFQLDHDFGYLDSQYLQSIINVQQAPIYGSNNNNHNSSNFELQEPLHVPHSDQLQLLHNLHLPELLQQQAEEEGDDHDFNTWFYHGPATSGQPNSKLSHLPPLQSNCNTTTLSTAGWALVQEKEAIGTHTEQQPLDMSWEMSIMSDDKQHSVTGHCVSSTTISAVRDYDESHTKSLRDMKSLSTTALASCYGHPEMSLMSTSTTDGESERGQHRRSMSCHIVDSAVEVKFSSSDQRMQSHHHFPQEDQERLASATAKSTDVSGMLIDLESKLVATLRNKVQPAATSPRQQQLQGGHMINQLVMSWEDSRTSESTVMTSSTPPSSGRRRRDAAHPQPLDSLGAVPSCNPLPATSTTSHLQQSQPSFNQEEPGIRLVNLLVGCADSVANKNFVLANSLLRELSIMVSPYGDTIQRVASYFTYGLAAHIAGTGSGQNLYRALGIKEPSASDTFEAFQVFCEVCPFIKFGEAATTQAVLEAFSGEENVHLIDLGMVQGSHWLGLLQGLASRNGGPPKMVHLTGVQVKPNPRSSKSISNDDQHGKQLKEFAEKLHLNFSCQLISVERLEQIQAWMLTTQAGQAIAVNCSAKMHTLLYQEHEMCINHVLSIVQSLRPKLFSLLEQEANHNVPHFLPRFLEALHFYSAMFDSLDATLTRISPERAKVEQLWLGQEIINILACEGRDRVERHERLQQWRVRMAKAGFRSLPLSDLAVLQVKTFPSIAYGTGFTVLENRGSLILSWQERPLFSCSMWTC